MSVATASIHSEPHAGLLAELSGNQSEKWIEHGLSQLGRRGDVQLLTAVAAAMGRCGLSLLGEALLQSAAPHVHQLASVQVVLKDLALQKPCELHHVEVAERYHGNIQALGMSNEVLARHLLKAGGPPDNVRFLCSHDGNIHVLRIDAQPPFSTVFPFVHHRSHAQKTQLPPATLTTAYGLIGVPSQQMLDRLLAIETAGYRPAIDILEPDLEVLRIWLCIVNVAEHVRSGRLHVFAGESAVDQYTRFLVESPARLIPVVVLTNHRQGLAPLRLDAEWRSHIVETTSQRRRQHKQIAEQHPSGLSTQCWKARFAQAIAGHQVLKVVGFTNRYSTVVQHAMRDLAGAFHRMGHEFTVVTQPDVYSPAVDVAGTLAEKPCDLIVAINHLRFEYADAMPANVPYVGWIQDHVEHLWNREAAAHIGANEVIITHAPDVLSGLYGYPRDRMIASSNLTDPVTYAMERLPDAELAPYRCDLSFVSHGASTPEALCEEIEQSSTPAFGKMMRACLSLVVERVHAHRCLHAQQLLEVMLDAERMSGHPTLSPEVRRAIVYPQVARIHDRYLRHQTLSWAANWARSRQRVMRIHGRGWDKHPVLSEYAGGEVASGRPLRALYQASRICLQANGYASLHQRLLDGIACGAMVISRWNPADFVRKPFQEIQQFIHGRNISNLSDFLVQLRDDHALQQACHLAERLSGVVINSSSDPRRRAQIDILQQGSNDTDLQTDEGLFRMLREMRYLPARVASDLPGFELTTFGTEREMHDLLDRLVDDAEMRLRLVATMRRSVIEHDTFDGLARAIIRKFAGEID